MLAYLGVVLTQQIWKKNSQKKHTIPIAHNKTKFEHAKEHFKSVNVLNL